MGTEKPRRGKEAKFKLNEPSKEVPGGPHRVSVCVDVARWPAIERRRELNRLLLAHDPKTFEENIASLRDSDGSILRAMARESVSAGSEPAVRKAAISALVRLFEPDNLNVVTEVARFGEDPYIRAHAMYALAETGLELALPVLRDGLSSRDAVEVRKAQLGLKLLVDKLGESRVRYGLRGERNANVRKRLEAVFAEQKSSGRRGGKGPRPVRTEEDR